MRTALVLCTRACATWQASARVDRPVFWWTHFPQERGGLRCSKAGSGASLRCGTTKGLSDACARPLMWGVPPREIADIVFAGATDSIYLDAGHVVDFCNKAFELLEDDPTATLDAIKEAVRTGAIPEQLGSTVAYAAFLRMTRFHTLNEFRDWDTVHNTLTAANALHQALKRAPSVELTRAVFDTAMSVYLDRFLNIPAQRMPEPVNGKSDADSLCSQLLSYMDVQQQVEQAAQVVADYLGGENTPGDLIKTLGHAMLREDSGFHMFQMVDAGFKQYQERLGTESGRHVLIGLSRFLAAHSPTSRAVDQTYQIAVRLNRGEELYRNI